MKVAASANTWLLKNITLDLKSMVESKEMEELRGVDWLRAISLL